MSLSSPEIRFKDDNGNDFPDWEEKKLGEVAEFFDGKRIPLSQEDRAKRQGSYPYYGASGIIDYIDDYIFEGEFVLLGEDGANILTRSTRLAFIISGKNWVNNHAHVMKAMGSNCFLAESLERIDYNRYNSGTAQPKLNAKTCKGIELEIPTLPEQKKIADFLTSVDDRIGQLLKKKALLEDYKKGVMQQFFSQKIRFKDDNGNDFPDWEEKKISATGNVVTGGTPRTSDRSLYDGDFMFVSPADIGEARYVKSTTKTLTEAGHEVGRKIPANSILFVCIGSTIGKVAQAGADCTTNQQINSVIPNSSHDANFLLSLLVKQSSRIRLLAGNQAVPILNKSEFSKISITLPTLPEQKKIADFLTSVDQKIESVSQQIAKTQTFKKGLLQQMFV